MIQVVSLDFWNTICISNPKFSSFRLEYLRNNYLPDIDTDRLSDVIEKVGGYSDDFNMKFGISIPAELMYLNVFNHFNIQKSISDLERIYNGLEKSFLDNPPSLMYSQELLHDSLYNLKQKGYQLVIGSNTAYIKGQALRKVLANYDILDLFNVLVFSDEVKTSKPASDFFSKIENKTGRYNKDSIIHIGDSELADFNGATAYGFKAGLIRPEQDNLISFLNDL